MIHFLLYAECLILKSDAEKSGYKAEIVPFRDDHGNYRCAVVVSNHS